MDEPAECCAELVLLMFGQRLEALDRRIKERVQLGVVALVPERCDQASAGLDLLIAEHVIGVHVASRVIKELGSLGIAIRRSSMQGTTARCAAPRRALAARPRR